MLPVSIAFTTRYISISGDRDTYRQYAIVARSTVHPDANRATEIRPGTQRRTMIGYLSAYQKDLQILLPLAIYRPHGYIQGIDLPPQPKNEYAFPLPSRSERSIDERIVLIISHYGSF